MKLSTRARYGTRLMLKLGLCFGQGPVFLKDIAKREEISEKYLSQIIIPLKGAGLVRSFRGAHGGYTLAKSPAKITIGDIVGVLEGQLRLMDYSKADDLRASARITQGLWQRLEKKIIQTLDEVTLADLIKQSKQIQDKALMYNI